MGCSLYFLQKKTVFLKKICEFVTKFSPDTQVVADYKTFLLFLGKSFSSGSGKIY